MCDPLSTMSGPDFLEAVADAELAAGHPVNADVFRQRSREWRQQQADYASLEARNHSLSQALDRARSALQPAA